MAGPLRAAGSAAHRTRGDDGTVTTRQPDDPGLPDEPEDTPPIPDEVWLRFLADSERAIRVSAPREPSAQERSQGRHLQPPKGHGDGDGPEQRTRRSPEAADAVGELWEPEDLWAAPAWRDLDGRARLRRAGRVIAAAAAVTLALGAWSWLSTSADAPGATPGDTVQQLEEAAPSATPLPPRSTFTGPSSPGIHTG